MPRGISRFVCPVVSLALLMPLVAAGAQEVPSRPSPRNLAITQVGDDFVIRAPRPPEALPPDLRLGKTIRLDRAIVARGQSPNPKANEGGIDETR